MTGLLDKLSALPQLQELLAALHSSAVTCCAAVTGLAPVHRAMFSAALAAETKRPLLLRRHRAVPRSPRHGRRSAGRGDEAPPASAVRR